MKRREFITLLGGAVVSCPRAIRAQSSSKRVIANLFAASMTSAAPQIDAILEGLRDLAYVQGRDFEMQHYPAEGILERLPNLAAELMLHNPDLILANPTPAIVAARALTQTIPIVSFMITNEKELGFVASHARPGGNVTGCCCVWRGWSESSLNLHNR